MPFWFEVIVAAMRLEFARFFGIVFSSHVKSIMFDEIFWLMFRLWNGYRRCIIWG